jgi:hypothetical protein
MTFMAEVGPDLDGDTVLLTVREAMRLLRIQSPRTLRAWERAGHGPQPLSMGRPDAKRRTLRYRLEDVRAFLRADGE